MVRMHARPGVRLVLSGAVVAALVAGCGGGGAPGPSPSASPSPSPTDSAAPAPSASAPTSPPAAEEPVGTLGTGPRTGPSAVGPMSPALLAEVRTGAHVGFSRVVFEFRAGGVPGWQVQYLAAPIIADPSGNPLPVAGTAFLQVRMEPAAGYDPDTGASTYPGPFRLPGPAPVAEVVRQGDFEGVLSWVIGVDARRPFAVGVLDDPPRLVVDVSSS